MNFVQLIASLYNRCNSETKQYGGLHKFWLPIVEIDGVECKSNLTINSDKSALWFIVESKNIFDNNESVEKIVLYLKTYCLPSEKKAMKLENEETFIKFCNDLKENITKLKLDLHGNLVTDTKPDEELISFVECFKDAENVKLKTPVECCVCTNLTLTKTPCNHALCNRCWFKLPVKHLCDDDDEECKVDCPLCRSNILFAHKSV